MEVLGADRDCNTLTHADLLNYIEKRRGCQIGFDQAGDPRYVTDPSIRKELDKLIEALRVATLAGKYRGNVDTLAVARRVLKPNKPRTRVIDAEEFLLIYERMPDNRQDYLLGWLFLGARYGELERIEPSHVDPFERRCYIVGHKGDADWRERWVPLNDELYRRLSRRARAAKKRGDRFLFSPWANSNVNTMLKRICRELGFEPMSVNDLRRTFITWHGEHGTEERDLKKLVGHSPASKLVERVYRQLPSNAGRAALSKFVDVPESEHEPEPLEMPTNVVPLVPTVSPEDTRRQRIVRRAHKLKAWRSLGHDELEKLVWQKSASAIGVMYGISSNAVLKKCWSLGIKTPGRGYWRKVETGHETPSV